MNNQKAKSVTALAPRKKKLGLSQEGKRKAMLAAAREMFLEQGYNASVSDIADRAGYGIATVYNYFGTKEGIFAEMIREDVESVRYETQQKLGTLSNDPVEAIMSLIRTHNKVFKLIHAEMMIQFIWQSKSSGPFHETASWMVDWQKSHIVTVLEHFIETGVFESQFDAKEAAKVIINLSIRRNQHHYSNFPGGSKSMKDLKNTIAFLVDGWKVKDPTN